MSKAPEMIERNGLYRWGRNDGRIEGVKWTLLTLFALAVLAIITLTYFRAL